MLSARHSGDGMDEDQNDGNGDDDATLVAELNLEVKPAPST
jgi:hypothetical protein